MKKADKYSISTNCVKESNVHESGESHVFPLHASSAFSYQSIEDSIEVFKGNKEGYVYSRYGNPTVNEVQNKLAKLEGQNTDAEPSCVMTSSGLSAISTLAMSLLKPGDTVLTQNDLYGGTTEIMNKILVKYGVHVIYTDLQDLDKVEDTLKKNPSTKLIYFETPSNPTLKVIDIKAMATLAQKYDALTAIDNTFSTFYLQQPMALGIDFVIYSTTKFLNGHGNSIAGAILSKDKSYQKSIWNTMKLLGTNCNAWDAWLLHNGLKTLAIRMDRHSSNAMAIAKHLSQHTKVKRVNYPGLESHTLHDTAATQMRQYGGMLSFEIDGDIQAGKTFMDKTELCTIAATLGNVDTLLLHPATSSHLNIDKAIREASGITDGLIRMSIGIEDVQDLIGDIDQALDLI